MTNCTILIPTKDRTSYLRRILTYYSDQNTKFDIIVGDSSTEDNKKINKQTVQNLKNLKIKYIDNYPSSNFQAYFKFSDMANLVKTKYTVFCADDDFITLKGIKESIKFLEKNKEFSTAQGYYINFESNKKGKFKWYPGYDYNSITFQDPISRAQYLLANYSAPVSYAVFKSKTLKKVYKEFKDSKVNPLFFGELLPAVLTLIEGKLKKLDVLYGARKIEDNKGKNYWPNLLEFINRKECTSEEINKFINTISTKLNKTSNVPIEKLRKGMYKSLSLYLSRIKKTNNSITNKLKKTIEKSSFLEIPYSKIREKHRKKIAEKRKKKNLFWKKLDEKGSDQYRELTSIRKAALDISKHY